MLPIMKRLRRRSLDALSTRHKLLRSSSKDASKGLLSSDLENPAAVLYGVHDLRYEQHDLPRLVPPGFCRVQIKATGICGSDLHFYEMGRIGNFVLEQPMVTGHESAGEVVALGAGACRLSLGAKVALEPGVPCWGSTMARQGRYNLDPGVRFFATPPVHGSLCRYVDHPEDFCHEMPDGMDYEEGALIEPLANALFACMRARVGPGKSVAILGAGTMGLLSLECCKALGATKIAITDIREDNLPLAEKLGAAHTLLTPAAMRPHEAAKLLRQHFPLGLECIVDCAGFGSTVQTGMEALTQGGTFALVGMGADCCPAFPMSTLVTKEADFRGCFRYTNIYPTAIDLVAEGRIQAKEMVSHRYGFEGVQDVIDGFKCAINAFQTKAVKVMFNLPAIQ